MDIGSAWQDGGHIWFKGQDFPDGKFDEFDEDCQFPIQDLTSSSPQASDDVSFTYGFNDINNISNALGLIWETSKDIPFTMHPTFIGFKWDIKMHSVSLPQHKHEKYMVAISNWQQQGAHMLEDVQKLHKKLLHASLVMLHSCAYLTKLEAMILVISHLNPEPHPTVSTPTSLGGRLV